MYNTVTMTNGRDSEAEPFDRATTNSNSIAACTCSPVSPSEVVAWVLVVILVVLFTGLLSVVLLWMFKKRQARDTSIDNTTLKYEMEGNPCYELLQSNRPLTVSHTSVRGGGAK